MLAEPPGHRREQGLAIAAAEKRKLFERPRLAGGQRQALEVEHRLDDARTKTKRAAETTARRKRHHLMAAACGQRQQVVHDAGALWLGQPVMLGVGVVAEIGDSADRAAALAEHLEAFAVERRVGRHRVRNREQHDLLERDGRLAGITDLRLAESVIHRAGQLHGGRRGRPVDRRRAPGRAHHGREIENAWLNDCRRSRAEGQHRRACHELEQLASRHFKTFAPSNSTTTTVAVGFRIGRSRCRNVRPFSTVVFTSAPPSR